MRTSLLLIDEIRRQHRKDFAWGKSIDRLTGSDKVSWPSTAARFRRCWSNGIGKPRRSGNAGGRSCSTTDIGPSGQSRSGRVNRQPAHAPNARRDSEACSFSVQSNIVPNVSQFRSRLREAPMVICKTLVIAGLLAIVGLTFSPTITADRMRHFPSNRGPGWRLTAPYCGPEEKSISFAATPICDTTSLPIAWIPAFLCRLRITGRALRVRFKAPLHGRTRQSLFLQPQNQVYFDSTLRRTRRMSARRFRRSLTGEEFRRGRIAAEKFMRLPSGRTEKHTVSKTIGPIGSISRPIRWMWDFLS